MSRQFRGTDTLKWTYGFGNGSDGDLTISSNTTEAPIDSACSGTAGSTSLTATNASFAPGQIILIHQTKGTNAGKWELAKIAGYTAGTITTDKVLQNTYTNSGASPAASKAQVRVLKQYNNVTIDSGDTYTCKAWNGEVGGILGFFAKGQVTINGLVQFQGKGFRAATEYKNSNGPVTTDKGEGSGTDIYGTTEGLTANGTGAAGGGATGGAGGGDGSGGGSGGSKTAGTSGYNIGYSTAAGGDALWDTNGSIMSLGGGAGARVSGGAGDAGSQGTDGSGIGFIFAKKFTVSSTGQMQFNSADGNTGGDSTTYSSGAGGAGSLVVAGEDIAIDTLKITAVGGAAKGTSKKGGDGGLVFMYSKTFSGTSNPTEEDFNDPSIREPFGGAALLF